MNSCTGTPAELYALPYVEGSLPEIEAERFEEHYFECTACLAYLQTIQAAGTELARMPVGASAPPKKTLLTWPMASWALRAVAAALLVVAVFAYRGFHSGASGPQLAQAPQPQPAPLPAAPAKPAVNATLLADLAMPAFVAPNLRGSSEDAHFDAGMNAYSRGDYVHAAATLAEVPAQAGEARAAAFYRAACQMHLGNLQSAAEGMSKVADAGDSPQQESAIYFEAQIALASNNPTAAHKFLQQTIALKGDLERKARDEDRKVLALIDNNR
jgi:hypothetical protein